jgi:hypothetical protein
MMFLGTTAPFGAAAPVAAVQPMQVIPRWGRQTTQIDARAGTGKPLNCPQT